MLGSAVRGVLAGRGHQVVAVGPAGDLRAYIADPAQVGALYDRAGRLDAVVSAAGDVPFKPITEMTAED